MKKSKMTKRLLAAVLSAGLVLQAAAFSMPVFAADPPAPTLSDTSDTSGDAITLSNAPNIPDSIKKGGVATVRGTVNSASSNLTSVTAGVYNGSGQFITGKTVNPGAKSYDLSKLDRYITFNTLAEGEYTFAIIASNSTKTNFALMNKKLTVGTAAASATAATGDTVTISGETKIPANLKKGQAVTVRGTITSDLNITDVTVGVYDSSNNRVTGGSVSPNAKTYNLRGLDNAVSFNKLAEGTYTYSVTARVAGGLVTLSDQKFTVGNATTAASTADDTLSISGGTVIPDTLAVGKSLTVTGTVTSASSNMTALTCGVYDSNNKLVIGKTVNPRSKTYDLNTLDYVMAFNKLTEGTYTYVVSASNAGNAAYTLVSKTFKVGSGSASSAASNTTASATDKLSISGGTNMPATLKVGGAVNVTGTVTSEDSNITSLTVGVYDASNNLCTGKTVAPNAKSYDIKKLDDFVAFNKLAAGSYTFAVIASNASNTNYSLVSKSFTVGGSSDSSSSGSSANSGLSISGGTTIPSTVTPGKIINITGTVSSDSAMTALTCGVYNSSGKFVTGRTINPKSKSYDLKKFDSYVAFNTLPAGSYTYAVIASNASAKNATLVKQKFTVSSSGSTTTTTSGDDISISGSTTVPASINKGKGMLVRGTVSSASSNLTSVTVGVYDVNGSLVTGKTVNPGAKSYNVNALDSSVRFNDLAAGSYYYRVIASNGANSNYTVVNQRFTVQ